LYLFVIRVTIFEMNAISVRDDQPRSSVPVLSRSQDAAHYRRDGDQGNSQRAVPPFLVVSNGDKVTISSKQRSDNALQGKETSAQVTVPQNTGGVPELRDIGTDVATGIAGAALSSETVRNTRSFGPYDIQANRYAMKRYREADSFKARHASTFETTA
jgi:hypothetical protein